jgi:hypothetical protein
MCSATYTIFSKLFVSDYFSNNVNSLYPDIIQFTAAPFIHILICYVTYTFTTFNFIRHCKGLKLLLLVWELCKIHTLLKVKDLGNVKPQESKTVPLPPHR